MVLAKDILDDKVSKEIVEKETEILFNKEQEVHKWDEKEAKKQRDNIKKVRTEAWKYRVKETERFLKGVKTSRAK